MTTLDAPLFLTKTIQRGLSAIRDTLAVAVAALSSRLNRTPIESEPSKTLFNPDIRQYVPEPMPYFWALRCLSNDEPPGFPEFEPCIFSDVMDWESGYLSRGYLAGALTFSTDSGFVDASRSSVSIPRWVEEDGLQLHDTDAERIILLSDQSVFDALVACHAHDLLHALFVTSQGIPRAPTRRLLHRMARRFRIPVFFLDDNDTWAYFIFSLLKRGSLDPADSLPYLAIDDLRFIGLRAGDAPSSTWRPWQQRFKLRLNYLRRYSCFASHEWQNELTEFEHQNHATGLRAFVQQTGARRFLDEYLKPRLESQNWLA